jgi:TonB family protein
MNTFWKAQLIVLVIVSSAALWAQAGSPSNAPAGESNSRGYLLNRVRVSGGVAERNLIRKIVPKYPQYAKENRIQGTVVLHAIIDKQGNVAELHTLSGHPLLAPTALEAVKQWRYKPYTLNGVPVEVETTITVNFNLAPMERSGFNMPPQRSHSAIPPSLQAPLSR